MSEKKEEKRIVLAEVMFKNFKIFEEFNIEFPDGNSTLVGANGSGKTTIGLDGLFACIKGIAEKGDTLRGRRYEFIGPKAKSAQLEYTFKETNTGKLFTISRKISKSSNNLAIKGDIELGEEFIKNFLGVSLLSGSYFGNLSPKEQALTCGIDVEKYDQKIAELKTDVSFHNRNLAPLKDIAEVEKVDPVLIDDLLAEKKAAQDFNQEQIEKGNKFTLAESSIKELDGFIDKNAKQIEALKAAILDLEKNNKAYVEQKDQILVNIDNFPKPAKPKSIEDIDRKIAEAGDVNAKANAYQQYLERVKNRENVEKEKKDADAKVTKAQDERLDYIKKNIPPIKGLTVDDKGGLLFRGRQITFNSYSKCINFKDSLDA
jgi:DNA repair exonuclease SbcCD ATPase subunit